MRFSQVDVFSSVPFRGNPLAVVHDADGLPDDEMAAIARWTNLSETAFLLEPTSAGADYRVRIFTPSSELPFAGHPTLGACAAWHAAGGQTQVPGRAVQECGIGLVTVRDEGSGDWSFVAPDLIRAGPLEESEVRRLAAGLGLSRDDVVDHAWVDNGPGSCALLLGDAETVLAARPDPVALAGDRVGVAGLHPATPGGATTGELEVRFFPVSAGIPEDPVTGSFHAGLAVWLTGNGTLPARYTARQGTALGRQGRVRITAACDDAPGTGIWITGHVGHLVEGEIHVD
ncbi:PhzF family phenazine biosynthesis protein [Dietzia maris]|uniref:PhzF family phenazine biosynthesis protein n=1 Tax=Dietzia maris TaxID=37915 RepID=UPI00223ABC20|nr:PhzF family phenazine biosynthesis protein [Dietzia maris]MCT1434095.1 PhzF family phenazine biosynthesis protein [Dietzia maris]MCT1520657.1 PhzF family phenazine biosynthesis protein [Dietzia maris]